ncbi:MAG TPA: type II toxin-antitoxin system Phd/YefM family antitoxin [Acidimicrobiales bacterium]|jgi:hypothetical protein
MAITKMTSREFNQDSGRAKREALSGPVYITDRGNVSHVLLSFEAFERLKKNKPSLIELLGSPPGIGDIEFEIPLFGSVPPRSHSSD